MVVTTVAVLSGLSLLLMVSLFLPLPGLLFYLLPTGESKDDGPSECIQFRVWGVTAAGAIRSQFTPLNSVAQNNNLRLGEWKEPLRALIQLFFLQPVLERSGLIEPNGLECSADSLAFT